MAGRRPTLSDNARMRATRRERPAHRGSFAESGSHVAGCAMGALLFRVAARAAQAAEALAERDAKFSIAQAQLELRARSRRVFFRRGQAAVGTPVPVASRHPIEYRADSVAIIRARLAVRSVRTGSRLPGSTQSHDTTHTHSGRPVRGGAYNCVCLSGKATGAFSRQMPAEESPLSAHE